MHRWWLSIASGLLTPLLLVFPAVAQAQEAGEPAANETAAPAETVAERPASSPPGASPVAEIRNDFVNFLHFATIGRFDYAQAHAKSLLERPEVNPLSPEAADTIIRLCQERPQAIDTLVILINRSTIGQEAGQIMGLIRQAHATRRKNIEQINASIRLLAGTPTEQTTGLERLIDSGEYAVPQMLKILADPHEKDLHPYVVRALPRLGKPAVNPLCAALSVNNEIVQRVAAESLGRLGYPQALPYLKRVAEDAKANPAVKQAAVDAIRQIVVSDPAVKDGPAYQLFHELAEAYYAEEESLAADPAEPRANVWVVDGQAIKAIDVPTEIYCMVMSMRASRASLELAKDQPQVLALWLAANFRRESRLGLDVQTAEKVTVDDPSQPADFPRSLYWAAGSGPACCNLVLARGLSDMDRPVVLGAIAGLASTAGPAAFQPEAGGLGLAEAIRFPDQLVRLRAALVLARMLPTQPFAGANEVVPVLGSAFAINGQKAYLLIEPDKKLAEKLAADLGKSGAKVIVSDNLELGLAQAARQVPQVDGVLLASDMTEPGVVQAVATLGRDERAALAPVVVLVKEGGMLISDRVAETDARVGRVLVDGSSAEQIVAKLEQLAPVYGYRPLTAEDGVALSLEACLGLQNIAAKRSPIFDVRAAEAALVQALNEHPSEEVRIATTRVLASVNTPTAQNAVAKIALSSEQSPTLRAAAFASLADSARSAGARLNDKLFAELETQARSEPNLELRTAASQALGAMINLPAELAVMEGPAQALGPQLIIDAILNSPSGS
ncbi:MAG TPA: HEAT repeat domain-containing protein [Phycisphaerae bacterium]|nr:HEAT repeat domain-containing protein [Phycisphaerae bacterium]HOJ75460.1 HEAT repeat domain-containing protein [Phycisphaerae bacterium]HOM52260.1 HEAT repeat domain-containing protein [Phycisphaerae bacterium]HPP24956.1 HEAT repeat domain-containing protein [Phycisphaerae bacterium]HQE26884.1 HEAT repeat domain-containing protein [Phycisphaerae bacterium]